jgi:general secretion pathway protein G
MILRNQKGMTLIEIIIVITIIASLTAVLGQKTVQRSKKAKVSEARIQIGELSKSLDMYYTDCGMYPTTEQGLAALAPGGGAGCSNWGPDPYIKKVPVDPWNRPFVYILENGSYTLLSYNEDGVEGGEGFFAKDITSND